MMMMKKENIGLCSKLLWMVARSVSNFDRLHNYNVRGNAVWKYGAFVLINESLTNVQIKENRNTKKLNINKLNTK